LANDLYKEKKKLSAAVPWKSFNKKEKAFSNHSLFPYTSRRSCHRSFQILDFLGCQARFFFILDTRQGSCLDLTARILPDFQEYKILDRTDKSCPASQDSVYMILG
jgi:hypothetical protein